jgi:D-alanine-D-alanine ligase-like ATP-grasp enzyme
MTDFRGAEGGARDHFPYITRSLLELYDEGALDNVTDVLVEPRYGHVARISYADGSHRITYGNDLGLNGSASSELATDKGHSKFILRSIGVACPEGDEFLLPWWAERIGASQHLRGNMSIKTTPMIAEYIEKERGYPVYIKPVDGSKGADIFKIYGSDELPAIFDTYDKKRVRVAMVEEPIDMPDYRVVTLDGELISAYRRIPLAVTGDGRSTVQELVTSLQTQYFNEGRDTRIGTDDLRICAELQRQNMDLDSVPDNDREVVLAAISNLSAGGTSEDVTSRIDQRWVDLATYVAKNFNLRLCGLDLACDDITSATAAYSVLEVNASPGLDHYASAGETQRATVHALYAKVFNASPIIESKRT